MLVIQPLVELNPLLQSVVYFEPDFDQGPAEMEIVFVEMNPYALRFVFDLYLLLEDHVGDKLLNLHHGLQNQMQRLVGSSLLVL